MERRAEIEKPAQTAAQLFYEEWAAVLFKVESNMAKKKKTNGAVLNRIFVLRLNDALMAHLDELVAATGENRQTLMRQMIRSATATPLPSAIPPDESAESYVPPASPPSGKIPC